MRPRLSRHAIDEAQHRGIPLELLEEILDSPEQLVQLNAVTSVYQSRVTDNAGRTYLNRATVSTEIAPGVVVTVYRTSKIDKYWRPQ